MELRQYVAKVDLATQTELGKVKLIAYYYCNTEAKSTFMLNEVTTILRDIGHPISNVSRLKSYLSKSKDFRKIADGEYMLTPAAKEKLSANYAEFFFNEDIIVSDSELLDETLFCGKRGFLDKLIKQVNHCYDHCCYDAAAVCMRRVSPC